MPTIHSSYLPGLKRWQYQVSGGFTLRGYFTPPSGKPLLHFIHGNGFNGLVYEKFLAPFREHFDLFISNAQGHGDSDNGPAFVDWDQSARYFLEVWQHFSEMWKSVPRIGMGHSFGAVNTLLMNRLDNRGFHHLVLLDPIIGSPTWVLSANLMKTFGMSKHLPLAKQAAVRTQHWPNENALWSYFHQRGIFKSWEDDCLRSYLRHAVEQREQGDYVLKCPPRIEAAIFSSYTRHLWPAIRKVRSVVDLYYGDKSYPFVLSSARKLDREFPAFSAHVVPGGHCFMQEKPESSAELVLDNLLKRLTVFESRSA